MSPDRKRKARIRRAKKARRKQSELGAVRLLTHRTGRHIYAQVISPDARTLASASSLDPVLRKLGNANVAVAEAVGKLVAERALAAGVERVSFDRNGFKYHGRISALAQAARTAGLKF